MLDFYKIVEEHKIIRGQPYIFVRPEFLATKRSDLMIRGNDFYAVWDDETKLWSTSEDDVTRLIDQSLREYCEKKGIEGMIPRFMDETSSGTLDAWHKYVKKQLRDKYEDLDCRIIFSNTETTKRDHATKKLPYPLVEAPHDAYDKLMSTLYDEDERKKLEWAVGAIISGDAKNIQKFIVLYGEPGSGKSTFLNIVQKVFDGYYAVFDAKSLVSNSDFALEGFQSGPLVCIQHDGDLSRIEDNTKLNSIVSHETMLINEKHKNKYAMRFNSFLFLGTNKPVKITDAKSGILRRLIDVNPSGRKLPVKEYKQLYSQIDFELSGIASHCLNVYKSMGAAYYDAYVPVAMVAATNNFYDFIEYYYYDFTKDEYISLTAAWDLYKIYCDMANVPHPYSRMVFKNELAEYFDKLYPDYHTADGKHLRNVYVGFKSNKFNKNYIPVKQASEPIEEETWLKFTSKSSLLDIVCSEEKAQLTNSKGTPSKHWVDVTTTLKDIDTKELHYVKIHGNHIVIDFDLKDENGEKSFKKNLEAASKWPPTYAELSKSGAGIHLHYIYDGDVSKLSRVYDNDIEVKVFTGNSSLRRKLTRCNDLPIATINSGLPLKEEKPMIDFTTVKNEKAIRTLIIKNLRREYHANTKPSIDFIYRILDEAYKSGVEYDVEDLHQPVIIFASKSSNQAPACLDLVAKMHFKSENAKDSSECEEAPIVFYDVEVFPNLLLINWKFRGSKDSCARMINPSPAEVEKLTQFRLIGFNCRRYDNHILYGRMMGLNNEQIYNLSQRIISRNKSISSGAMYRNAYNLSYADIYDFMEKKQSLKKWEIELGIHHQELGLPWDQPVPEELWPKVAEYCDNDVIATEALFETDNCQADFTARQIIAKLSGLTVNDTTNSHSARIIFGTNRKPQAEFNYPDLSKEFPGDPGMDNGYKFEMTKREVEGKDGTKTTSYAKVSSYRDNPDIGEGGCVIAEPGMYEDVWVFDVASMHPHSIIAMNLFGDKYTAKFKELVQIRLYIKHGEFDKASQLFDGAISEYLTDKAIAKQLSKALKIVINSVYGLTSAAFENPFKDPRNVDNVVAKRGALFMIELKHQLELRGVKTIHIKTDSIKIASPSEEIKEFIYEFGKKFGYTFEVEHVFSKLCLANKAVYIGYEANEHYWEATGAQFAQPFVYKTLFSKEPIIFEDMCETKQVTVGAIHLDTDPDGEHNYQFVGRVGLFCPMKKEYGATLVVSRENKNGEVKYDSVTGTSGYRWLESEYVKENHLEDYIDRSYYTKLVDEAYDEIAKFGDPEIFINSL